MASTGVAVAEQAELVCPGDPLAGVDGLEDVKTRSSTLARALDRSVVEELIRPPADEGELVLAPMQDGSTTTGESGRAEDDRRHPDGARVTATGQQAPGLVAAQLSSADSDDVAGLATTPCLTAAAEHWLVAGGGQAGRQERLLLVNPGDNAVSVDLEVVGAEGEDEQSEPAAGQDIVVPASGRQAVLLDGITSTSSEAQVVRVRASGGTVGAWVADRWVDGLRPSGLEVVPPTADPSSSVVLAGVPKGAKARLVVAAPGRRDAIVTVRSVESETARSIGVETIPAGSFRSVELPDGPEVRAVQLTSDEPVVAAAEVVGPVEDDRRDLAWTVAAPAAADLVGASLPELDTAGRRLVLTAPGEAAEVSVTTAEGGEASTRQVSVDAERSTEISLDGAEAVWLRQESDAAVHAAVTAIPDGDTVALSSAPLLPARVTERSVDVVPRP